MPLLSYLPPVSLEKPFGKTALVLPSTSWAMMALRDLSSSMVKVLVLPKQTKSWR
jgi:hypothetical protein